jgi:hypothetical protein
MAEFHVVAAMGTIDIGPLDDSPAMRASVAPPGDKKVEDGASQGGHRQSD